MAQIGLKTTSLSSIQSQIRKMQSETDNAEKKVLSAISGLDFEISSKQNISSYLNRIKKSLVKQSELAGQYHTAFINATDLLADTDGKFASETKGILDRIKNYVEETISTVKVFFARNRLAKIAAISDLFIAAPSVASCYLMLKDIKKYGSIEEYMGNWWSNLKNIKKITTLTGDISDIIEEYGGSIPEWVNDITDSDFFKGIGYITDAEKLINAVKGNDIEKLGELLGKYGVKNPAKELFKLYGESSAGVGVLADIVLQTVKSTGKITGDFIVESYNMLSSPETDLKDCAKFIYGLYNIGGKIQLDTAFNVVGDKAKTITEVLNFIGVGNFNEQFENYTGQVDADIKDFYTAVGSDISSMYKTLGFADATKCLASGFAETIATQTVDVANTIAGWVKSVNRTLEKII